MKVAYAGFGDIPFHMTQVSKFGFTDVFNLNEPLLNGEKIRYAFLTNWISGIFLRVTDSWAISLHLPVMIMLVISYILIFLTYRNILGKSWAALMAVIMFMLGSGLGAWTHIRDYWLPNILDIRSFVDYLVNKNISTVSYLQAIYPNQNIDWGGAMSLVLLHQRSFFLGLLIFSVVVYTLSQYRNLEDRKWLWLAGIALGLGPLAHYHTTIVLALILFFYFWVVLLRGNIILVKRLLYMGAIASVIALPQIIYLISGHSPVTIDNQSFINFRLGWMVERSFGSVVYPEGISSLSYNIFMYLKFLLLNFGLILPLVGLSFICKPLRRGAGLPVLWFTVLLFVFVQVVRTQPWDYDTNKILVYFSFFASASIMYLFVKFIETRRIIGSIALGICFIGIIFSGVVDIIPRTFVTAEKMPVIFNRDAIRMGFFIKQNVEPSDVVITSSTHLNPVSSLAGRPTIVGYPGWLWTKGVAFSERENDVRRFLADPDGWRMIVLKYKAKYVLLDSMAAFDWKADKQVFDSRFKLLFNAGQYSLYEIAE